LLNAAKHSFQIATAARLDPDDREVGQLVYSAIGRRSGVVDQLLPPPPRDLQ
jgi:hypothetical protein